MITTKTAFIVLAFVSLLIIGWLYSWGLKQHQRADAAEQIANAKDAEVTHWKNKDGQDIARAVAAETDKKTLEESIPQLKEELKRDFNIKLSNVQAYLSTKIESVSSGTGESHEATKTVIVNGDTSKVKGYQVKVREPYFHLDGFATSKDFSYTRQSWDTLTFVSHFVSPHKFLGIPFGKQQLYIDGKSADPNTTITGLTNYQVKDFKEKRFGVGPFAGITLKGPMIGIGVNYDLIRF